MDGKCSEANVDFMSTIISNFNMLSCGWEVKPCAVEIVKLSVYEQRSVFHISFHIDLTSFEDNVTGAVILVFTSLRIMLPLQPCWYCLV